MPIATIQKAGIDLELAPPIGRKISTPVKIPSTPIQRGEQADAHRVDHRHDHPRREREPREQVEVVD